MLLHHLLYGVGSSICQAAADVEKTIHKSFSCSFGMFCWETLLQIVEGAHTVAMEINRYIAISFLVFSLSHFPADDNYRVQLFTAISM